jgi:hypothetical protein
VRGSLSVPDRETAMMRRARVLIGSVFVLGLLVPALPAQRGSTIFIPPESSSHRRLGGGLEDMTNPETLLAERLTAARLHRLQKALGDKKLDGDLAKLAGKLLRDEKFIESLKGQMSREDIARLRTKFREGELTANDKGLRDLLDKAKQSPDVDQRDRAALDEFAQKLPDLARPDGPRPPEGRNGSDPPPSPEVPGSMPAPPDPARGDEWLKGELGDFIKNLDKWGETPAGKSWAETLKKFAGRIESGRASTANLGERNPAFSRWLGKMNGWDAGFRTPRLGAPSVPNVGVPSGDSLAGASGVLVVLLGALVLALILWRGRDWFTSLMHAGRSAWKLGPWPVRPEEVTTRGDLVRAFEYLALLCLGPAARTCHHLELGERIGGQPALDAERRRESATALSRIYERARYTPDQEPLPGEDLRRARRELAYLAGARA